VTLLARANTIRPEIDDSREIGAKSDIFAGQ
jgi:hypothetical protein